MCVCVFVCVCVRFCSQSTEPVPLSWLGTEELQQACKLLKNTAVVNCAVGLAAQQCGVNARIIYLQSSQKKDMRFKRQQRLGVVEGDGGMILINPRIVGRSPELDVRIWREECLVLPPTFRATVLRDDWIDVEFLTPAIPPLSVQQGQQQETTKIALCHRCRLTGEMARSFQHEYDHDRGILITDHVSLEELENDVMRSIEQNGHETRMQLAYTRHLDNSLEPEPEPWVV